jgi:rSAM/selenodomain-associated transferase 1
VATAFLLDTADRLAQIDVARVWAFTPATAHGYFAEIGRGRFHLLPQIEGDLGQRMAAFFGAQFGAGAAAVVLVGTDSPTLPLSFIVQAFQELQTADVVIGPSTDGGYYLIGCAARSRFFQGVDRDQATPFGEPPTLPPVFAGISWGAQTVLSETVAALHDSEFRLALLPPWYDVDTWDGWRMLQGHVAALRCAGHDPGVPNTERLLLEHEP